MITQIILAILIGCFFGIITGLTPGVHINLISIILINLSGYFLGFTSPISLAIFIIAMSITHSFLDTIPATFLGAPDPAVALGVLPGHKLLLEGRGYEAVKLTVIGSLCSLILTLLLIPLLIPVIPFLYEFISPYIGYMLAFVIVFMIVKDIKPKKVMLNLFIVLLSGCLGLIVLNFPNLKQPLFPMLSGLFGISTLLMSLSNNVTVPEQKITQEIHVDKVKTGKALGAATFSGIFTGFLPGLGSAHAAIIAMNIVGNIGNHAFMILIGGINTVNFLFSIATLYALEKARNGAIIAVMEIVKTITLTEMIIFLVCALIAGCIATFLALKITKVFAKIIPKINYKVLCYSIIGLVGGLVLFFTGFYGILVLAVATVIGMLPPLIGVNRSHAMGCLLIPVVMYFLI